MVNMTPALIFSGAEWKSQMETLSYQFGENPHIRHCYSIDNELPEASSRQIFLSLHIEVCFH